MLICKIFGKFSLVVMRRTLIILYICIVGIEAFLGVDVRGWRSEKDDKATFLSSPALSSRSDKSDRLDDAGSSDSSDKLSESGSSEISDSSDKSDNSDESGKSGDSGKSEASDSSDDLGSLKASGKSGDLDNSDFRASQMICVLRTCFSTFASFRVFWSCGACFRGFWSCGACFSSFICFRRFGSLGAFASCMFTRLLPYIHCVCLFPRGGVPFGICVVLKHSRVS